MSATPPPPAVDPTKPHPQRGTLNETEVFFRDHQVWLQEKCGYMLPPRYMPDWIPSWQGTDILRWNDCFDGKMLLGPTLDAIRIRDKRDVALKILWKSNYIRDLGKWEEIEIAQFFQSNSLVDHPHNHCVPILEILDVPDENDCWIMVMPLLRPFTSPRFDTFGEAVDFFEQIFEGLKFMHDHNVAHRDCGNSDNIMMDASRMFPDGYSPRWINKKRDFSGKAKFYTRTQRPPKYYFIDFGLSRKYSTRDPPPLEPPISGGGDRSAPIPEFATNEPCDPFPTDVYYLGSMIKSEFLESRSFSPKLLGLEFMIPLIQDMMATDPAKRPSMDEVVVRFAAIKANLSRWKLRSRVVKDDDFFLPVHRIANQWFRRIVFILRRTPAVPHY
ncbi:kinase-like domain-containing protein [Mycena galericulata]|nr:kinase-like domain-containing protein [Mycena galericulata]